MKKHPHFDKVQCKALLGVTLGATLAFSMISCAEVPALPAPHDTTVSEAFFSESATSSLPQTEETTVLPILPAESDEAPVIHTEAQEQREPIPYETIYEYSEEHDEGTELVKQEGENGERLCVTYVTYENGERTDVYVQETVTKAPVSKIVVVGTKKETPYEIESMREGNVYYAIETQYDDTRYDDERIVLQKGVNGYVRSNYKITYDENGRAHREFIGRDTVYPTNEIVLVGTIPAWTEETEIEEGKIPFETRYSFDQTLPVGTRYIRTEGKDGYAVRTYTLRYYRGELAERVESESDVTDPVHEVVVIGTGVGSGAAGTITPPSAAPSPDEDETQTPPNTTPDAGETPDTEKEEIFVLPFETGKGYYLSQDYHSGHLALDFAIWYGDPILAVKSGTVIMAYDEGDFPQTNANWTYGTFVVIEHENGVRSLYAHLESRTVSVGDKVTGGQMIGTSGNTGRVNPMPTPENPLAGTHLHFEIREKKNGSYVRVDPKKYIPDF